jgi:hypothetical protein
MKAPSEGDASDANPGELCLRLVAGFREIRVVDARGAEHGLVRPLAPGLGWEMRRAEQTIWSVRSRSVVLRRHALEFPGIGSWDVRTPFFWWMNIWCRQDDATKVLGQVGPRKWLWFLWVAPGTDTIDVLSAVAFLHRRWWRH